MQTVSKTEIQKVKLTFSFRECDYRKWSETDKHEVTIKNIE